MDSPGTVVIEELDSLSELSAANDGVINKEQILALNELVNRYLLHLCHLVTLLLVGRHKASRPGRSIFDKRSCKRHTAFVGISDGVRCSGIRHSSYIIQTLCVLYFHVMAGHDFTVAVTHGFNIYSLVV